MCGSKGGGSGSAHAILANKFGVYLSMQPHSSQCKPVSCQFTGGVFLRHVVSRTRISFEQGKNLSHWATTRGKGKTCNTIMTEQAREYVWGKNSNWIQLFQKNFILNVNRSLLPSIVFPQTWVFTRVAVPVCTCKIFQHVN